MATASKGGMPGVGGTSGPLDGVRVLDLSRRADVAAVEHALAGVIVDP